MKLRTLLTTILILLLSLGVFAQQTSVSATGFITDTLCGKSGANPKHIEHAKQTVASGKAKYAIYDERTKQLYILDGSQLVGDPSTGSGQAAIEQYLGQRVTITGTLSATPVKRAGQKLDPASGEVVRHTPRAGAALDTSTPVAGVLAFPRLSLHRFERGDLPMVLALSNAGR